MFQLCRYAQEWANKLAKEDKCEHRPDNPYGENLFSTSSLDPDHGVSILL